MFVWFYDGLTLRFRALEEIRHQNKKIAVTGLRQKLKQKDAQGLQEYLEYAKVTYNKVIMNKLNKLIELKKK